MMVGEAGLRWLISGGRLILVDLLVLIFLLKVGFQEYW